MALIGWSQVLVLPEVQRIRSRAISVALGVVGYVLLHPMGHVGPLPNCVEEIPS